MKKIFSSALAIFIAATASAGPLPIYENFGLIGGDTNTPPQIDALAFANYGIFSVFSLLPFEFENTRAFTNRGAMLGTVGFQFDTAVSIGVHEPAESFVNYAGSQISAAEPIITFFFLDPTTGIPAGTGNFVQNSASFLLISAENIQNYGLLSVG